MTLAPVPQPMADLRILPIHQELARIMAEGRMRHKETRRPENDRGSQSANYRIDYYGALAEISLYAWLEDQGERLQYQLVSRYPERQADLVLRGLTFDVKSVPPGKRFLTINAQQHQKRHCQYYWPVSFSGEDRASIHYPFPWQEASSFDRMDNRHSPYFSTSLDHIRQHDGKYRKIENDLLSGWINGIEIAHDTYSAKRAA